MTAASLLTFIIPFSTRQNATPLIINRVLLGIAEVSIHAEAPLVGDPSTTFRYRESVKKKTRNTLYLSIPPQGATFPSTHALLSTWSPPKERSTLSTIIYAGDYHYYLFFFSFFLH